MAYHIIGRDGVVYETDDPDAAQSVIRSINGPLTVKEGPVDFLRLTAKKKFGQDPSHYASGIRG